MQLARKKKKHCELDRDDALFGTTEPERNVLHASTTDCMWCEKWSLQEVHALCSSRTNGVYGVM